MSPVSLEISARLAPIVASRQFSAGSEFKPLRAAGDGGVLHRPLLRPHLPSVRMKLKKPGHRSGRASCGEAEYYKCYLRKWQGQAPCWHPGGLPGMGRTEMPDRSQERPLFIAPQNLEFGLTPRRTVLVRLGPMPKEWGFDQNLILALDLSPSESRAIAQALTLKADEAEGGQSRNG